MALNFQKKRLIRGAFCKWIERYVNEIREKSGNSTTFVSNETKSSVNNRTKAVFGARYGSTPLSNVTVDGRVN